MDIEQIIKKQRQYFKTGVTLDLKYRLNALKRLLAAIESFAEELSEALFLDLGKSRAEAYISEISQVKNEIKFMVRHLPKFMRIKKVKTPLVHFLAKSRIQSSPYGVVLIMSPWNYPFLLTLVPLIDALSAGNTAVLKPSDYSSHTSIVINKLIAKTFDPSYVTTVLGGREENQDLLNQKFDYIFFTGGKVVGQLVMRKAAKNITPFTLELGGKSPCIVDSTAKIAYAARRIVFGKFLNCGQTCVAPDYLLVHKDCKAELIENLKAEISKMYTTDPLTSPAYGKIINQKHFTRLTALLDKEAIIFGGAYDEETLKIAPTILDNITIDHPLMAEEIFGPILPIITYQDKEQIYSIISHHSHPLALYIFSQDKKFIKEITSNIPFGGGAVNDTVVHLATSYMGFGGVGQSGIGSYHGKRGYETFSHYKSILYKSNLLDISLRYPPYPENKEKLIRKIIK